jgi:hypothetical protein
VQEIVLSLDERGRHGAGTTMVKVHEHTGEPLHAVAEAMETEGADRKMEADDRPMYEIPEPTNLLKRRNVGREVSQPGRGRLEGAGRGDTAVRRLGGDRVNKEPDTALLPGSMDVQEVEVENGQ